MCVIIIINEYVLVSYIHLIACNLFYNQRFHDIL